MKLSRMMKTVALALTFSFAVNAVTPKKAEAGYIFVVAGGIYALQKLVPGLIVMGVGAGLLVGGKSIKRNNADLKFVGSVLVILNDNQSVQDAAKRSIEASFTNLSPNGVEALAKLVADSNRTLNGAYSSSSLTEAQIRQALPFESETAIKDVIESSKSI